MNNVTLKNSYFTMITIYRDTILEADFGEEDKGGSILHVMTDNE
jgi:hypothetical protein